MTTLPPRLAVVVPTHNRPALLARTLESLTGSESRRQAYGFDVTVAIACAADPGAALVTLESVAKALSESSFEVLMLVPSVAPYEPVLSQLSGDVQTYAVGDVTSEQAWRVARNRAAGARVLLLRAGEVLDPRRTAAALRRDPGTVAPVGTRPARLVGSTP